jgi:hypothetical protein
MTTPNMDRYCMKSMSRVRCVFPLLGSALLGCAALSAASFTNVDISSYVNGNVQYGARTFPTGTTTGNQNTGIPFNVATFNGIAGNWSPYGLPTQVLDVPLHVSGQASFYALLNNIYGTPRADEYDITIKATNGDSITYQSIGGVDTRDYNSNVFTNTIANTTFPWFDNGIGQRLDVREFNLPASFQNEIVSDFIITQLRPTDAVLFSGLTFSDVSYTAPEPRSILLIGIGGSVLSLFPLCRRRRRAVSAGK